MGIHGENPPLMRTRKKIVIEEERSLWQNLSNEVWQKQILNGEDLHISKNLYLKLLY